MKAYWIGLLALALLATATGAATQKVYRCGPDGREYSQIPCKEGRVVDAADPRSEVQQREGREVADNQRRLARQLEAERKQREAAALRVGAAGFKPIPPPEAASAASAPHRRAGKGKAQPTKPSP